MPTPIGTQKCVRPEEARCGYDTERDRACREDPGASLAVPLELPMGPLPIAGRNRFASRR